MLHVSRSLPDIAVIRGGKESFSLSLSEGQEVLQSLSKLGYKPLDVLVDREGNWTTQGIPTDAHAVYSRAHTIVDTTRDTTSPHIGLARRMGVTLLFSKGHDVHMDREDMYRLLRMQGVTVPDTVVVRAKSKLPDTFFRDTWSKNHIPLMIRPLVRREGLESKLVSSYPEFEQSIRDYQGKGVDVHILTYRKVPTSSISVIPNFRNEELYMPLWVETFSTHDGLPNAHSRMQVHANAPETKRRDMKDIATKVVDALNLSGPACIDVIPHKDGYMVVNVDRSPSLRKDGRFMQSLSTTGVHLGQYINSTIEQGLESDYFTDHELTR